MTDIIYGIHNILYTLDILYYIYLNSNLEDHILYGYKDGLSSCINQTAKLEYQVFYSWESICKDQMALVSPLKEMSRFILTDCFKFSVLP